MTEENHISSNKNEQNNTHKKIIINPFIEREKNTHTHKHVTNYIR